MKGASLFFVIFVVVQVRAFPSVKTQLGVINGKTVQHAFHGKHFVTNQFLGIPYAKPPIGRLRFKRPQPYGKFSAPLKATEFGPACPQNDVLHLGVPSSEEDCLSLNVYVPTQRTDGKASSFPVMIYIHGGGFYVGASSLASGHVLSAYGEVILVTVNYRLGIFGFANTGDDMAPGNMGLWDQRLAIQWVNENIASFKGDTSRVTIFGESAGAISVSMHAMFPANRGLFQSIITESGTATFPFPTVKDNVIALTHIAKQLGCSINTPVEVFTCINSTEAKSILSKSANSFEQLMKLEFWPTVDGHYIKRPPLETLILSKTRSTEEVTFLTSLNVINGINTAEGGLFVSLIKERDIETTTLTPEDLKNNYIAPILQKVTMEQALPDVILTFVSAEYTDWTNPSDARMMYIKFNGDLLFNVPGYEMSLLIGNSSEAKHWVYSYAAKLQNHVILTPSWVAGANHADELMSVFGYGIENYGQMVNVTDLSTPEWELDLSETVMRFWSNFAKYGDPNGPDTEKWPRFDAMSQKHLTISRENVVGQYLYTKEVNFWREIVPLVLNSLKGAHSTDTPFSKRSSEYCDKDKSCG